MRHNINTIESSSSLTDMHDEGINDNDSLASDVPDPFLVLEKPDPLVPEIAVTNLPPAAKKRRVNTQTSRRCNWRSKKILISY